MVNFPIFTELHVEGYGLFPGPNASGLHISFKAGLTLILGSNGLGKTTLITLLYRMLTGPSDIPALSGRGDLGNADLAPTRLPASSRQMFANRVADNAQLATATLKFRIGATQIIVERRLKDLALVSLSIDGNQWGLNEDDYQKEMARLVEVWSFGDLILILRHLVFYFEDRRALVWDASAQRQLLRALFLPQATAKKWTERERAILELDSRARNLSATLYREEQALALNEKKVETSENVRAELNTLQRLQRNDYKQREKLEVEITDSENIRSAARLRLLKAEQSRDAHFRDLERAKLTAISARFPSHSDTAKYILAQLMTDGDCLACGHHAPTAAKALEKRIRASQCVVCGTSLEVDTRTPKSVSVADKRVSKLLELLESADAEVQVSTQANTAANTNHDILTRQFATLDAVIADRTSRIDALIRQLPPGEGELHQQRGELASMRARLEVMREQLNTDRTEFGKFVKTQSRAMVKFSQQVISLFQGYAQGFLFESCSLTWAPQGARLGQGGDLIEFPAYELDMSGADFSTPTRRTGPEQVSESQSIARQSG